ncbi:myosin heavy chain MYA2-related [Trypanosoma grayi]|uniref:myosin heavy chain MYA2-related n=1 Tax=Trypanosoma grayi TaxID=71804 RepID=UPI0004F459F3|nr:myosin heavy chain MYA2-related [Trypanosoma grayi]KEG12483.1 myosin heavy chain MYA2-related [Trypanosoma grayi]
MLSVEVGSLCFFNHPMESWVVARVSGKGPKGYALKTEDSERKCIGEYFDSVPDDAVTPCREDLLDEQPDDLLTLTVLHDAPLLRCLYLRYFRDIIYTNIGAIVVAINPYNFKIPWYEDCKMVEYLSEGPVIKKNLPHSWAQAHNTYNEMIADGANQCILVSGESGAGKTEATKIVVKYLAQISCKHGTEEEKKMGLEVGARLNACSPILECFGNARTVRNDNSSRFGKFMKVKFDEKGRLVGAETTKYLLEKSRIVTAAENERVYHSFYLIVRGAMGHKLQLESETVYRSLNAGNCLQNSEYNSVEDYNEVVGAMGQIGMKDDEVYSVWSCVAGILCLLNVAFEADGEGARVEKATEKYLKNAVRLLRIDEAMLWNELVTTTLVVQKTSTVKLLRPALAVDVRDALVKALYDGLFTWLVDKCNQLCDVTATGNWIGLLDIFGFEDFKKNSFEQLCINLTNETLQNHYNKHIFEKDMEECRAENIDVTEVVCPDNSPCLRLIVEKGGILALLDEECTLGKGSELEFLAKVNDAHMGKNKFFEKKKVSRDTFIIHHYAASVTYDVNGWLEKNRDTLKENMKVLMRNSKDPLICELLEAPLPPEVRSKRPTVGSFFKGQLAALMEVINNTNPHWIRCIKPHPAKCPLMFDGVQTMRQLESSGVLGTVKIRKAGYPVRNLFDKFNRRYKVIAGNSAVGKGGRELAQIILTVCGMKNKAMAQLGRTKVFMKAEAFPIMERRRNEALAKFCRRLQSCGRGYLERRRANSEDCEQKRRRLVTLLTKEYRAYMRRFADLRQARARWRKEQGELFLRRSAALYEECVKSKAPLQQEALEATRAMHTALRQRMEMLKTYAVQMQKERQDLIDADLAARGAMLKEAAAYIDYLRHLFQQERVLFVTMLVEDLCDDESEQRHQIRNIERGERDKLWRADRSRYVAQRLVDLAKEALASRLRIEAMEAMQREEERERRALEQRNRSYLKSFKRKLRDTEVIARQLTCRREKFEEAREQKLMQLQGMYMAGSMGRQERWKPPRVSLIRAPSLGYSSAPRALRQTSPAAPVSPSPRQVGPQPTQQQHYANAPAVVIDEITPRRYSIHSVSERPSYGGSTGAIVEQGPSMRVHYRFLPFLPLEHDKLAHKEAHSARAASPKWSDEASKPLSVFAPLASPYRRLSPRHSAPLPQAEVYLGAAAWQDYRPVLKASSCEVVKEELPSGPRYKRSKRWA